jgi:hypothetical protein
MPSEPKSRARLSIGAALFAALLAWIFWRHVLQLPLYAWDTFPLIAAGRVESFDGFVETLRCELMAGRFAGGHYWRPLVHLSFALDWSLWGLDAFGYRLSDLAILAASTACVIWVARELAGRERAHWAYLAGFAFALHPVHFEIVPLPPRRADALSLLFTLVALLAALRKLGGTSYVASIAALLAVASKETGALVPLLLFVLGAAAAERVSLSERFFAGLKASWIAWAAVGLFLAGRSAILGGLGGGARAAVNASELPRVGERYAELVLAPLPPVWVPEGAFAWIVGLVFALFLAFAVWRARSSDAGDRTLAPRAAGIVLATWILALVLVTTFAGTYRAWYALPFVAPLALLVALSCSLAQDAGGVGLARTLVAALGLGLFQGWISDGSRRWNEIDESASAAQRFLGHFDDVVTSLAPGSTAELSAYPAAGAATRHGKPTSKPLLFREYSLEAYSDLAHPSLDIRVEVKREARAAPAGPNEILVLLLPREGAPGEAEE